MLEASLAQPAPLSAKLSAPTALPAKLQAAGAVARRPATREQMGEVVVGDLLDIDESGRLSVSPDVRDYGKLSGKPTIEGTEVAGALTAGDLGLATPRDVAEAVAGKADGEEIPVSFIEAL